MPVQTLNSVKPDKIEMIPLNKIINKFDVRVALDQDRMIQLAGIHRGKRFARHPHAVARAAQETAAERDRAEHETGQLHLVGATRALRARRLKLARLERAVAAIELVDRRRELVDRDQHSVARVAHPMAAVLA